MELGKLEWGRYPDIDKTNEKFVRYFEIHGLEHLRVRLSLQQGRLMSHGKLKERFLAKTAQRRGDYAIPRILFFFVLTDKIPNVFSCEHGGAGFSHNSVYT